jgi:putative transposase
MPRRGLRHTADHVLHVLNRAVRRDRLFHSDADYAAFEQVLAEALTRIPTRLLAFCVMPNHWHLVVWPTADEIPRFMHWLTATHTRRWHIAHDSRGTGHVYQNRYHALPVQTDTHLIRVLRYVERNPLRAELVERAESWRWGSLWHRAHNRTDVPLSEWPLPEPADWVSLVNAPQTMSELREIQASVGKGIPVGTPPWTRDMASRFGIRLGSVGRPRKIRPGLKG